MQTFLEKNIDFLGKKMWPPYSPAANPLDYAFWPHVERNACMVRHGSVDEMKAAVDLAWAQMSPDYIRATCIAFRKRLTAIVEAEGGRIE